MGKYDNYIHKEITKEEAINILKTEKSDIGDLASAANKTREIYCGNDIFSCTITNAKSGKCTENCQFCAQSSYWETQTQVYPMKTLEEILADYYSAKDNEVSNFAIVTSGREMRIGTLEFDILLKFLKRVKGESIKICASIGLIGYNEAEILKREGLTGYHNNIQTSINEYKEIVATTHSIKDKIKAIYNAKKAGLEVCSGGIIGMGESLENRVDMIFDLKELDIDGIPLNILNPIKGTPFENRAITSVEEAIKMTALLRLILKNKKIVIAAGRDNILKDFMGSIFLAGANGMLIGGYLTVKGRNVKDDIKFIKDIKNIWGSND